MPSSYLNCSSALDSANCLWLLAVSDWFPAGLGHWKHRLDCDPSLASSSEDEAEVI